MTIFDLLFILLFFLTAFSLLAAAWFALRHEPLRARKILTRILIGAGLYVAILIVVSLLSPRQILHIGECQKSDDMCFSIEGYQRLLGKTGNECRVDMKISNTGIGRSQRENNLVMYLTDDQGRRYDAVLDGSEIPFNILVQPKESAVVSRLYVLPENDKGVGAVITHEGGFPIRWLIIGYDSWFRKPPLVPLW
ncbi:MAG: hypothetical protein WAK20_22395 [Candidatus Acidiferrum sp.]